MCCLLAYALIGGPGASYAVAPLVTYAVMTGERLDNEGAEQFYREVLAETDSLDDGDG